MVQFIRTTTETLAGDTDVLINVAHVVRIERSASGTNFHMEGKYVLPTSLAFEKAATILAAKGA